MHFFDTPEQASDYLGPLIDRPVTAARVALAPDIVFEAEPIHLDAGFTNSYTVRWRKPATARILVTEPLTSAREFARQGRSIATSTAGFFFLADRCRHRPRTLSLNLAVQRGRVLSLPVASQDALVSTGGMLSVVDVPACGVLSLDGRNLRWAGSRTDLTADCYAYGNANSVILHQADERTGKVRVFQEESRFTPQILDRNWCDLGFTATEGCFVAVKRCDNGRLDIFQYDLVLRCPRAIARAGARLEPHTIGSLTMQESLQGAVSVGPALSYPDLCTHPLNDDRSLGSFPLLRERPATRLVFYETTDGWQQLRLFDSRPGSATFRGLTLAETVSIVTRRGDVVSGCLLDSGHTSKLNVRRAGELESWGNRHYLRWPTPAEPRYTWHPDQGRPTGSLIALG